MQSINCTPQSNFIIHSRVHTGSFTNPLQLSENGFVVILWRWTWGMYNCNPFQDPQKLIELQKLKKPPQAFRQSHRHMSWLVLSVKNSFGCCLNHCTQPPTQHQMIWMERFLYPKIRELHIKSLAICRTSEQLPPHGIWLVLLSVCHMMMGMVMQQHDTLEEFTLTFILDIGTHILSSMTVRVCTICVIIWLEIQQQGTLNISLVLLGWIQHLVHHLLIGMHQAQVPDHLGEKILWSGT